jgi:protein-L-isoaspartate(D-aspartate) O-methyltransferase
MEDTIHHKQLRANLITTIRSKGITNDKVLAAISKVPRHLFLTRQEQEPEAYKDIPLDIGQGQTISQPFTVAYQTQLLDLHEREKVLEIGTGSGYQAAVLFELGAEVYTIERQKKLYSATKLKLSQLGYAQIHMFYGDGNKGLAEHAPFDKVIVTAAAPGIPAMLVDQLRIGGVMVIPVDGQIQKMLRVTRTSATETNIQEFDDFRFVPLLEGTVEERH